MVRVKKLKLSEAEYAALQLHTNGLMTDLAMALQDATGVSDLRIKQIVGTDPVYLYVESSMFPDLGCCYLKTAPLWEEGMKALQS